MLPPKNPQTNLSPSHTERNFPWRWNMPPCPHCLLWGPWRLLFCGGSPGWSRLRLQENWQLFIINLRSSSHNDSELTNFYKGFLKTCKLFAVATGEDLLAESLLYCPHLPMWRSHPCAGGWSSRGPWRLKTWYHLPCLLYSMVLPRYSALFLGRRAALHPTATFYLEHVGMCPLLIPQPRLCSTQVAVCDLLAHHSCRQHVLPLAQKYLPQKCHYTLAPHPLCFLALVCHHQRRMWSLLDQFVLPLGFWSCQIIQEGWAQPCSQCGSQAPPVQRGISAMKGRLRSTFAASGPGLNTSPQPSSTPEVLAALVPSALYPPWAAPWEQREVPRG